MTGFFKTSLFPPVLINSEVRSMFGRQQKNRTGHKKYCELRYQIHRQAVQCYENFECKLMKKVERRKGGRGMVTGTRTGCDFLLVFSGTWLTW